MKKVPERLNRAALLLGDAPRSFANDLPTEDPSGFVDFRFLRGNRMSHGPLAAFALQAGTALAISSFNHVAPHAVED